MRRQQSIVDSKARRARVELIDALGMLTVTRVARHRESAAVEQRNVKKVKNVEK